MQSLLLAAAPAPAGGLPAFVPPQLKRGSAVDKVSSGLQTLLRVCCSAAACIPVGIAFTRRHAPCPPHPPHPPPHPPPPPTRPPAPGMQDEEGGEEVKLRIAWQYRRYLQGGAGSAPGGLGGMAARSAPGAGSSSAGSSGGGGGGGAAAGSSAPRKPAGLRDWCHQFDLLKSAGAEGLAGCRAELVDCSAGSGGDSGPCDALTSMQRLVQAAAAFVQSLSPPGQQAGGAAAPPAAAGAASLPPRGPQHVGRLAVLSLGSLGWQATPQPGTGVFSSGGGSASGGGTGASAGTAVLRTLLQLKGTLRDRRCAAVVSVPAMLFSPSDLARMQHLADGVVALESVADGSDIARWLAGCGRSGAAAVGGRQPTAVNGCTRRCAGAAADVCACPAACSQC